VEFLQQNKLFAIVVGAALLALIVLWPSLFGLGPTVVTLDASRYNKAEIDLRKHKPKMDQYYPKSGKGVPMRRAVQDIEASNKVLQANLDEMRTWMTFVPRYPFRIPETRAADDKRREYVTLAYNYALFGELMAGDECTIKDQADGIVWLASTRNVPLLDKVFGMPEVATPGAIKDPETRIMQIALVHELGHLAIRLNVDEITSIVPAEPYRLKLGGAEVAVAYPLTVRIRCDPPTLLAFLHALDGAHGRVAKAPSGAEEPVDPTKPTPAAPPKPEGAPADGPEAPGPAPGGEGLAPTAPAPRADATAPQKLILRLTGSPSYLSPDAAQGALKERFTIFRPDPADPQQSIFVANAMATKVLDPGNPRLTPDSILNWRAFCAKLRSQSGEREPNASKRLWELLPPAAHTIIEQISDGAEPSDAQKADLLAALNDLLAAQRDLHHPKAFAKVAIANEAEGLLKLDRKTLAPEELARLNRRLLEAAYPQQIAKLTIQLEAAVEPDSDRCPATEGKAPRNPIREGDLAATRFFLVRALKVKSIPGTIARDATGFPNEPGGVMPPHLEVELQLAALRFLTIQAPKTTTKRAPTTDSTIIPRGF